MRFTRNWNDERRVRRRVTRERVRREGANSALHDAFKRPRGEGANAVYVTGAERATMRRCAERQEERCDSAALGETKTQESMEGDQCGWSPGW